MRGPLYTGPSEMRTVYTSKKDLCKRSLLYKGSMLWNDLPDILKESSSLDVFKSNYLFIILDISDYILVYLSVDFTLFQSLAYFYNFFYISLMHLCIS